MLTKIAPRMPIEMSYQVRFVKTTNLALTPNPSPKFGRGEPEPQDLAG
ncbi:hypothetical protein [Chamaesiphon sp. OTE_8_metabat_110]|nr:hypothetical protein [Chamaesiphon sp. OTE_8_metabat_110]